MDITILQRGDIIAIHSPDTALHERRIIARKLHAITGAPVICNGQPISILRKEPAGEPSFQAAAQPEPSPPITDHSAPGTFPDPDPIRITRPGYHAESGLWFFADSVFSGSGCALELATLFDRGTTIEIEGTRYLIGYNNDSAPLMQPRMAARGGALEQLLDSLKKTHGTAVYLAIGGIIAYAFAPETLAYYNAAPGTWIYGRKATGKTNMAGVLMALWGMDERVRFESTHMTKSGFERLLTHFSSIPVHFDEYRESDNAPAEAILRACFNRQATAKGSTDSSTVRTITPGTSPLITGEGQPGDSALASRYIMVECVRTCPENPYHPDKLLELAEQCRLIPHLFAAGRDKAAQTFRHILNSWLVESDHLGNDRQRLVMGIAYAAFATVIGENSEHTCNLKAHVVASLSDLLPPVAPPAPEPELPPLGHNLTYPKDAKEIEHLNRRLPQVLAMLHKASSSGNYEDARQELLIYRRLALKHNRPDCELFDCMLAWSKLGNTGEALRSTVANSLAAANLAEISSKQGI